MNQLSKPRFFNFNSWNNIISVIGFVFGFIQFLIPDDVWELKFKIVTAIAIFLLFIIVYLIFYIISINKFYKNYLNFYKEYNDLQNRHNALSKQFNDKNKNIEKKDELINEYKYVLYRILNNISIGIIPVSQYEKAYLENLYKITYNDIEHLNNIDGGNWDGRNF